MNVIVCNFQNQDVFRHRFYPYSPKELDNITRLNDRLFYRFYRFPYKKNSLVKRNG